MREWGRNHFGGKYARTFEYQAVAHLYRNEKYDQALAALEKYTQGAGSPEARIFLLRGLCWLKKEEQKKALLDLQHVIRDFPASPFAEKAIFLIGWTHLMEGEQKKAAASFNLIVKKYPEGKYAKKAQAFLARLQPGKDRGGKN